VTGAAGTGRGGGDPLNKGLARERTALAWNRSGLALIVCAAIVARRLWPLSSAQQLVVLGMIAGAVIVWAVALFVLRAREDEGTDRAARGRTGLMLMTVATELLAAGAIALTLVTPP
jgi:uncharacterized membrane protein YidH (DUF202 family)